LYSFSSSEDLVLREIVRGGVIVLGRWSLETFDCFYLHYVNCSTRGVPRQR
jgi:hypothetical protein